MAEELGDTDVECSAVKMSLERPRSVWIRSLGGDFAERRSVTVLQAGCCSCSCSCCCVQAPVNAACGLASGLLLPAVGPLRSTRPITWPLRLRLTGAGLLVGAAHGTTALFLWPGWQYNLAAYVGGGALLAVVGGVLVALALRADRWHRATLGLVPRYGRSLALGAALGCALGSLLVSAVHAYDRSSPQLSVVSIAVGVAAVLGLVLGWWLVRRDEGSVPWPQPYLARTLGSLIGANLAATLTAIGCNTVYWWSEARPSWALPGLLGGLLVAAAWSGAVCVAKARQRGARVQRSECALVVATDGLVGAAVVFAGILIAEVSVSSYWHVAALILAVMGFVAWTLLARRYRPPPARDCGEVERTPRCLCCGYNLTGLTSPRCPECGEAFEADIVQRLARTPVFPITFWHPLSMSPVGGALAGACLVFLVALTAAIFDKY